MSKVKSNAILDGLPENQRTQLEAWLFEENISYKDAAARLLADFSVRVAPSSLSEWYQRVQQQRMLDRIAASRTKANLVVKKFRENPADMYQVLLDMAGQIAFDKAFQSEKGLDAETIFNFTKLVMQGRKQAMEAEQLALARDRFQFDAADACLKKLPELRAIAAKPGLDQKQRIQQIRLALFGAAPE